MDYQKAYDNLITKYGTWEKPKNVYTERHRKVPGYVGGKYTYGNAFYVPARVHYLCHLLLAKFTGDPRAWNAVTLMSHKFIRANSKLYQIARIKCIPALSAAGKIGGPIGGGKVGPVTGMQNRDLKRGVCGRSKEKMKEDGSVGSRVLLASMTKEEIALKMQHMRSHRTEEGLRVSAARVRAHAIALTFEQRSQMGKKGGKKGGPKACKITNAQVWKCETCGMETKVGPLGKHQKRSGHTGRLRIL